MQFDFKEGGEISKITTKKDSDGNWVGKYLGCDFKLFNSREGWSFSIYYYSPMWESNTIYNSDIDFEAFKTKKSAINSVIEMIIDINETNDSFVKRRMKDGGNLSDNIFDATKIDLNNPISSRVYFKGVDNQINQILKNDYKPIFDFDKKGIEWVYKNTIYNVKNENLIEELTDALAQRNRGVVDMMRINSQLPTIQAKYGKNVNFSKRMYQEAKDFYENKLRNEKSNRANEVFIDYLISRLKENKKQISIANPDEIAEMNEAIETLNLLLETLPKEEHKEIEEAIEILKMLN
jgi:hypothetical protein